MLVVNKNQHRWMNSIDEWKVECLLEGARQIKTAWGWDGEGKKEYPINTDYAFEKLGSRLKGQPGERILKRLPPPPPPPTRLSDILNEKRLRRVFEQQNTESFPQALRIAKSFRPDSFAMFRKIMNAIESALQIEMYGIEAIPKPRIHFLHRELLEIADIAGISDLHSEGFTEFFNDMCPCGKSHKADTIRKLRNRHVNRSKKSH